MRETDPSSSTQLEPGEAPAHGGSVVWEGLRLCTLPQDLGPVLFVLGSSGDIQAAQRSQMLGVCIFSECHEGRHGRGGSAWKAELFPLQWSLFNLWLQGIYFIPFCPSIEIFFFAQCQTLRLLPKIKASLCSWHASGICKGLMQHWSVAKHFKHMLTMQKCWKPSQWRNAS